MLETKHGNDPNDDFLGQQIDATYEDSDKDLDVIDLPFEIQVVLAFNVYFIKSIIKHLGNVSERK